MHFENLENGIAWLFGLVGGCLAVIYRSDLIQMNWGSVGDKLFSLAWAAAVALVSGAAGVLGKKLIEWFYKKRKNNRNGSNHH